MGTYDKLRDELSSGDLVFFRESGGGFFPRLIRRATMSDYCHVGVVWRAGDRVFVLEARQAQGVSLRLLSEALPVDWIKTGCRWTPDVETAALMRLQTRYSIWAAIALGLGIAPPDQAEACSLFAADAIWPGLAPTPAPERRGLTPGHLAEIFMAAGALSATLN